MKIEVSTTTKDILELFESLDKYTKIEILNQFTFEELIKSVEEHLKGETDYWSWDTNGYTFGSRLREAIAKIEGTHDELLNDHKREVRSLKRDIENYKQYYDWYWKIYHYERYKERDDRLIDYVERLVGKPK